MGTIQTSQESQPVMRWEDGLCRRLICGAGHLNPPAAHLNLLDEEAVRGPAVEVPHVIDAPVIPPLGLVQLHAHPVPLGKLRQVGRKDQERVSRPPGSGESRVEFEL
jgi:hypothetical protein